MADVGNRSSADRGRVSVDSSPTADRIVVLDDLYPKAFVKELQDALLRQGWTYSEGAHPEAELVHWVTELASRDALVTALLSGFRRFLDHEDSYRLERVYCNGHVCSDCPLPHQDSGDARDRTVLVYANAQWQPEFAGETVFFDDNDEIIRAVVPRPGRVVIFDSTLRHCARPPTKIFLGLRLTVAFKFKTIQR